MAAKKSSDTKTPKPRAPRAQPEGLPASLAPLVALLAGPGGTARAFAEKLGVSKPTVYAQLAKLRHHKHAIEESEVREGAKGPPAKHFRTAR